MGSKTEWPTERLLVRRFRPDDFDAFHELHGDADANPTKPLEWHAVERKSDGAVIGVCWLGKLGAPWEKSLGRGHVELGYRYARRFWGNGYATEAARGMLRRGFEELELAQVMAIVDAANAASERILQKVGMKYNKTFEQEGMTINFYTLNAETWASTCSSTK